MQRHAGVRERGFPPDAWFAGSGFAGFGVGAGGNVGQQVVVAEYVLTLLGQFQIRGQFTGAKRRPFLDTDVVL